MSVIAYVSLGSVANGTADVQTAARLDDAIMSMRIALLDGQKIESAALASGDADAVRAEFDTTVQQFDDALARLNELGTASVQSASAGADEIHEEFQASVRTTFDLIGSSGASSAVINIAGRPRFPRR